MFSTTVYLDVPLFGKNFVCQPLCHHALVYSTNVINILITQDRVKFIIHIAQFLLPLHNLSKLSVKMNY